jgi:Fe-S oxidoreductase
MERERVFKFTEKCFNGEPASCSFACPFRLDLRSFIKKMSRGRWNSAYKDLCTAVLFPVVVSRLCEAPCQNACQRYTVLDDDALAIQLLERSCIALANDLTPPNYTLEDKPQRIAVVGAGVAGLSCALRLAQKHFNVHIFERLDNWGGRLRQHPEFTEFEQDFRRQTSQVKINYHFNQEITDLEQLEGFDAVMVTSGKNGEHFELLPDWRAEFATTARPGVFLGGELTGLSLIDGMAQAGLATRSIEAFLLSGSSDFAIDTWDTCNAMRYVSHENMPTLPQIQPKNDIYTAEEAKAEAARCLQCDCEECMDACELLIRYKKKPPRIASDVFQDAQGGRNSVSKANISRQSWSCNLCDRCTVRCDHGADLSGLFQLSRSSRVDNGYFPPAYHAYWLEELDFCTNQADFSGAAPHQSSCEYAFFPGCRLSGSNPQQVKQVYRYLTEHYQAGLILNCCGIPAWWAGEDRKFLLHLEELTNIWQSLGCPTLVLACPSCGKMLEKFLPHIPFIYIYQLLADTERPAFQSQLRQAALFDPCAAQGNKQLKQAVRQLLERLGIELTAYDSDGQCCGYGGHMQLANPELFRQIICNRIAESDAPYVVYCANCWEVFTRVGKQCIHVLDLLFGDITRRVPTLSEKKKNSLLLKQELMREFWGKTFEPEFLNSGSMKLRIPCAVSEKMEEQLISEDNVVQAIRLAEESRSGFVNAQGEVLCSMEFPYFTCCVLYRMTGDSGCKEYEVRNVYSYRMKIRGDN